MYILVVGHKNGSVDYYGPFKTAKRACEYALSLPTDSSIARWFTAPITTPFHGG